MIYKLVYGNESITLTHTIIACSMREAVERVKWLIDEKNYQIYSAVKIGEK